MKRFILLLITASILLVLFAGCGVTQSTFDTVVLERDTVVSERNNLEEQIKQTKAKHDNLLTEKEKLQTDYNTLKSEYDTLLADTVDWLKLTDEQKAEQLAKAEVDRIKAEEAAKKEAEAKAAAEAEAKKEAEEKAAADAKKKEEEEKKGYNTEITYNQLARNPEDYEGEKVKFKGEVLQVTEVGSEIQVRLATKANSWGGYSDNVIYVFFDKSLISSRVLDDDIITIYGVSYGLHSYTTVLGAEVTLPLIEAQKIDQ